MSMLQAEVYEAFRSIDVPDDKALKAVVALSSALGKVEDETAKGFNKRDADIEAAVDAVVARFGRLDVLVNNAGIATTTPALDLDEAQWDAVLDTNLKGAFLCARAAARAMRDGGSGAIVNVASILGLRVAGGVAAYAASKAGLVPLTKALALEWARHGIRVNALCPGYVETDINRGFFASEAGQAMAKRIPQRRIGRAEDLDGPLLLLASDASAYMTGAVVAVDGGHLVSSL